MKNFCNDREVRLKFLFEAGKILQSRCPSVATYLNTYGSNLARNFDSSVPACWTKKNLVCIHCLTPWNRNNYCVSLRPAVKPSKKIKYIIRKKEKNRSCCAIENKLIGAVHLGNRIVLKCLTCSKLTLFSISKGRSQTLVTVKKKKVKKKKKKDYLAGLNPAVNDIVKELDNKSKKKSEHVIGSEGRGNDGKAVGEIVNSRCRDEVESEIKFKTFFDQVDVRRSPYLAEKEKTKSRSQIIAPLGSKSIDFGSCSEAFIPLDSKSKKKLTSNASIGPLEKEQRKFINPFAVENRAGSKKKQKRRLDHLQQMLVEEKNKSKSKSSCFKNFLTLI